MKIGDVYLVEILTDGGHEQAGLRPALIVQSEEKVNELPTILIVPLTSKTKASIFPFTFLIEPDQSNNLSSSSVALVFQLRAIDKRRLKHKIGKLEKRMILHMKQILKEIMELNTK
ncbi:type II toxin-antitoxin system PemK/MazF family toxin [bacterium]|nr:type II toxin-antitoxin system PemK/MazF family toxin [bacterium]